MVPSQYSAYEQVVSVAAVNFNPVIGDKQATLAKLEADVVEAAAQGANLVVFPEEALSGAGSCADCRAAAGPCEAHLEFAETVPGPTTERVARLARELDVYVIFGLPERDREDARVLYNAAAIVAPEGIRGTYRKIHLGSPPWVTEGITFRPGNALPIWETRYGPIGVLICYDFWLNPELSRLLALKGARLIANCCASFAGPGKREYVVQTTATRALENVVYAVSANQVGGSGSFSSYAGKSLVEGAREAHYAGHSTIAGPAFPRFSHVYAEAGDTEEIVSATLSFEKLHRWDAIYPWREWRRTHQKAASDLIAREFQRL
jgi:predicted amidohydrolase